MPRTLRGALRAATLSLCLLAPTALAQSTPDAPPPTTSLNGRPIGVALSFDDSFIDSWAANAALLARYGVHATFYVTRYHLVTPERRELLRTLRRAGHEIAYHGTNHTNAAEFLQTKNLVDYVVEEVTPDLELMRADGFEPRTFAYPHGGFTPETDAALARIFGLLRKSGRLRDASTMWRPGMHAVPGASLDEPFFDAALLGRLLDRTRDPERGGVAVLYTHEIAAESANPSHITPATLETALRMITERGLRFYTMSELTMLE